MRSLCGRKRKNLQEGHLDQIWDFLRIACFYHSFLRKPGLRFPDLNFPLSNCGKTASFTLHSFEQGSWIIIILTGYYHPYFKGAMHLSAFPDNLITLGKKVSSISIYASAFLIKPWIFESLCAAILCLSAKSGFILSNIQSVN